MATNSRIQGALDRLIGGSAEGVKRLDPLPAKGARPGAVATGRVGSGATSAGAFVEADFALREYHAAITQTTSDGVFTVQEEPIAKVVGENGMSHNYKAPPAP